METQITQSMEPSFAGSIATSAMGDGNEKLADPDNKQDICTAASSAVASSEMGFSTMASTRTATEMGAATTVETPKAPIVARVGTNFVIPKNKALVPVTRSTSKWEPLEPKKEEPKPLSRKSRWGPDLTEEPAVKRGRALALQTRAEQLAAQLESNNLEIDYNEGTRSPSPPPLYDALGHRMNTREGRKREQLDVERREAIGECMKLNPSYKPPSGFRPVAKEAKLFIPVKENPGYNFIGLILGPRGNTQKRLESETGCKITIRGKGSIKDGKLLPYRHGKDNDGASEDLHVHISAETFEKVDAAVAIIEPLLIPVDEDRNIYKMKQLRELAEMNGTVRDFIRICTLCGEEGHRDWQCPKEKLQTFNAKVICRLCGDGSHPTMDCPLKFSGQGRAIDKEYLSFLEELGAGLGGIDPPAKPDVDNRAHTSGADTSQPMLLTASGAQPMPSRWMESDNEFNARAASDGGSEIGGFPRFPFPFPFPPPGPHGMNLMNFLPRFFPPALLGLFRGRPPLPPLQMMAFMLSAFRGRFPFPPFGFRPNMMRPPVPPSSAPEGMSSYMPMETPTSGQSQTCEMVAEEAAQRDSEAFLPMSGTFDSNEKQHTSAAVPVASSAEAPSFLSSSLPFSSATASPVSKSTFPYETTAVSSSITLSSAVNPVTMFSSVSTPNVPPPEMPLSAYPISPVPPQPVLPSFRPLPSVRPVVPPVLQSPSFTHVGGLEPTHVEGPGLVPPVAPPPWVGTSSNVTSVSGLDNLYKPSQTWSGSASWSQSQYSMEPFSTPQVGKPASEYAPSQFFPTPSTLSPVPPVPPRVDTPYFNTGENPSGPSLFPTLRPPSVPAQFGSFTPRPVPFVTPPMPSSFTPGLSQISQGQFGGPFNNEPKDYSFSHPDSRLGPPPVLGPQYRSVGLVNATPPVEDYHSFSSLSQRPVCPPDAPVASRMQMSHDYHHSSTFPASEFSCARPQEPSYAGSHLHGDFRNIDVYQSGRVGRSAPFFENQEVRGGGATTLPSEGFGNSERNYRYEPSIPVALLHRNVGSVHEPWNANLHSRSGPGGQQAWGQPESGGDSRRNLNPQNAGLRLREGDPEYDKLMSSVGIL